MSPKRNRLASAAVERMPEGYELDLIPIGGQEPFRAMQMLSSGRMLLGPLSREDVRTLRDSLTEFLKGEKKRA
jgi:hypothetical protein